MAEKERGTWVVGDMYSLAEILSWSILWNNYFQGLWFHIMNMLTWANAKDKATSIAKMQINNPATRFEINWYKNAKWKILKSFYVFPSL